MSLGSGFTVNGTFGILRMFRTETDAGRNRFEKERREKQKFDISFRSCASSFILLEGSFTFLKSFDAPTLFFDFRFRLVQKKVFENLSSNVNNPCC